MLYILYYILYYSLLYIYYIYYTAVIARIFYGIYREKPKHLEEMKEKRGPWAWVKPFLYGRQWPE